MKKILLLLLLSPFLGQSQTVNLGAGLHDRKPMFNIDIGYENKIVALASYEAIPVREAKSVNFYYGLKVGYKVKGIAPQVGYFFSKKGFSGLAYFLKYSLRINDNGGVYIEGGYIEKPQASAGFKINLN